MRFSRDCLPLENGGHAQNCPPQNLSIKGSATCAAARWGKPGMLRREKPYFSAAMLHRTGMLVVLRRGEARGGRRVDVLGRTQHDGALVAARLAQIATSRDPRRHCRCRSWHRRNRGHGGRHHSRSASVTGVTLPCAPRPVDMGISAEPRESDPFGVVASRESRHRPCTWREPYGKGIDVRGQTTEAPCGLTANAYWISSLATRSSTPGRFSRFGDSWTESNNSLSQSAKIPPRRWHEPR